MDPSLWEALSRSSPWLAVIGTLISLLALVFRSMVKGLLVPRSTLQDMRQDRDTWRKTAEMREEQLQALLVQSQLTNQLLSSLKASGGEKA